MPLAGGPRPGQRQPSTRTRDREKDGQPVTTRQSGKAAGADADKIDKRRVTMTNWIVIGVDGDGKPVVKQRQATDYVRPDILDAYVADARTRWQTVEVSDEPDAGPAGYHGATHVPATLDHPLAGQFFPATQPQKG